MCFTLCNATDSSKALHIIQPTLSRQMAMLFLFDSEAEKGSGVLLQSLLFSFIQAVTIATGTIPAHALRLADYTAGCHPVRKINSIVTDGNSSRISVPDRMSHRCFRDLQWPGSMPSIALKLFKRNTELTVGQLCIS